MEEYKNLLKEAAVPSLFILLITISSILFGYAGGSASLPGISLLTVSLAILPFIYKNSIKKNIIKKPDKKNLTILPDLLPLLFLIIISTAVSLTVIKKIHNILNKSTFTATSGLNNSFYGSVLKIYKKRYSNEVIIQFSTEIENITTEKAVAGIAYLDKNINIEEDDTIKFKANIKKINPNGKISSYELRLFRKGIYYKINIKKSSFGIIGKADKSFMAKLKTELTEAIDRYFSTETSSLLKALYLGNRNYIDKTTINDFKRAGLLHLLSASGLHVGILAAVPLFVFGIFRLNRKLALIFAFSTIMIYLYLTSFPVSLLRASIMFGVYSLQEILNFDKNIYNTLFISAVIILVIFPFELYNPGFQLSFGATAGILLFFNKYRDSFSYLPAPLSNSISVTLAAQLFVMPIILYHMGEINLSGFISNITAVPLTGIILILSLFTLSLSFIHAGAAQITGLFTDNVYALNMNFIKKISSLNYHYTVSKINPFLVLAFILLFIPLLPNFWKRKTASIPVFISLFMMWSLLEPGYSSMKSEIIILNHSRGKTILIKNNRNMAILGRLPGLKNTIRLADFMKKYSFDNLNIYMTDPDFNNIMSGSYLIKKFVISKCFLSSDFYFSKRTKKFFKLIDSEKIELSIHDFKKLSNFSPEEKVSHDNINIDSFDNIIFIYNLLFNYKDTGAVKFYYPEISLKETIIQ